MNMDYCPFCGAKHEDMKKFGTSSRCMHWEFVCDLCGAVAISEKALERIRQDSMLRIRLINLLVEKAVKDRLQLNIMANAKCLGEVKDAILEKMILIVADNEDLRHEPQYPQYTLAQMLENYPATVIDRLDRAIGNIGRLQSLPNPGTTEGPYAFVKRAHLFAESGNEILYFATLLSKTGWFNDFHFNEGQIRNGVETTMACVRASLSLEGWKKFEELEKNWQNSNTVFLAMWFDDCTKAYREAVKAAIKSAGYDEPVIIDAYEHNNFIMDEVINKINEARFVIADFTCVPELPEKNGKIPGGVRGGVYFEAGYARGLGKEVIVTCCDSDDAKKRRHFDIDQINTLFWHENGGRLYDCNNTDFSWRLAERIKATVGKGKLH